LFSPTAASSPSAAPAQPDTEHRQPALPELPEPGRVVEVRGATWAVADVKRQGLPRSPADEARAQEQHVVTLQSLDEDRLGEELAVIWELEVGHTVVPDQGLPLTISAEAFDDPNTLGAFVDAVRWGAVTSADAGAFQSPFRSGANVEAYQLEPLRRALTSPRTNLLLADDVGLGKTIEAGLVIQELLLRHRARTVVIVCPPSLSLKWQDEMRDKFGLDFVIVDSALMAQVRRSHGLAANPFRLFPRVIISMAWLPSPRAQRLMRDVLADTRHTASARRFAFDMLVVDEAHHVAPASPSVIGGGRGYAVDSLRTQATRALAERCEHRLFLSATPHNGHTESFTALLEMIDNRRFSRGAQIDRQALDEVKVRRLKSQITDKDFKQRSIQTLPFTPTSGEEGAFDDLATILDRSARANALGGSGRSGGIVSLLLKKRFLSSPWAFARTLELYDAARRPSALADPDADYYAEVLGSGQSDEEEGLTEHPEFTALRAAKINDPLSAATSAELDRLVAWGRGYQHRPDSRLTALLTMLDSVCRPDGRTWSNERVVVFTEYADTLEWIVDVLTQRGYGPVLDTIQGSTPPEKRELTKACFNAAPDEAPIRVLVATDAAGEGIDLQAHCHRLVSFDVPFNPSRLEQRIGRIDRYGQRETPLVYYFSPDHEASTYAADARFLRGIAVKVSTVQTDLGSVNPLIDEEIQRHFGVAPARRPARATSADVVTDVLASGRTLNASLTDLARTYDARKETLHLTPFNARRVVDTALTLSAQPTLVETGDDRTDAQVFAVPSLSPKWQRALDGLDTRLAPGVWRRITFDDHAATDRTDLVHIHLGHPLLQKSARILRNSLFGSDSRVHRVTAVVVDGASASCVAAVSRLVLVGRGGLRLHEEVFLTGIRIRGRELAEEKVESLLDRTLDSPDLALTSAAVRASLARAWNADDSQLRDRLDDAMRRRAERQHARVSKQLDDRRDGDLDRAYKIFAAFRVNLVDSLRRLKEEEAEQQLMLLPDDQQRQRQRDIRAMEDRLRTLDDELARELAGIRERYADVQPYVSAAAVVFALTSADAEIFGGGS
jgi:superfamily II DNA or RNA helicase